MEDKPNQYRVGYYIYEEVGISAHNVLPMYRFDKPDWMTQDEFEQLIILLEEAEKGRDEQSERRNS